MYAFHMHIERGNQENNGLICIKSYRIQRDESWARTGATDELSTLNKWVTPEHIYMYMCARLCNCCDLYAMVRIVSKIGLSYMLRYAIDMNRK